MRMSPCAKARAWMLSAMHGPLCCRWGKKLRGAAAHGKPVALAGRAVLPEDCRPGGCWARRSRPRREGGCSPMPTEKIPPSRPIASSDIPWAEWSDVPRFAVRYRHLSLAALGDSYRVGVAIDELPPGKQSSPAPWPEIGRASCREREGQDGSIS